MSDIDRQPIEVTVGGYVRGDSYPGNYFTEAAVRELVQKLRLAYDVLKVSIPLPMVTRPAIESIGDLLAHYKDLIDE